MRTKKIIKEYIKESLENCSNTVQRCLSKELMTVAFDFHSRHIALMQLAEHLTKHKVIYFTTADKEHYESLMSRALSTNVGNSEDKPIDRFNSINNYLRKDVK
jgi:IS1 family transposase